MKVFARRDAIAKVAGMLGCGAAFGAIAQTGDNCDPLGPAGKALVKKALAALAAGDHATFLSELTEDVKFYVIGSLPNSGLRTGRNAVRAMINEEHEKSGLRDYREEIVYMIAGGEIVTVAMHGRGKNEAGEPYSNEYGLICRVRSGRIAEISMYIDTLNNPRGGLFVQARREPI